jgi:hypothetical protein
VSTAAVLSGRLGSTATTCLRLHALFVDLAVRRDYLSPAARALRRPCRAPRLHVSGRTRSTSTSPCAATTRLWPHALYVDLAERRDYSSQAARALRQPRRAPRVRVPRHVAQLVTRLVAPLVVDYSSSRRLIVDYSTSRRLVVDYFAFAARPGASARRATRRAAHRRLLRARHRLLRLAQACRRLLRLRRASGCLGTSRGSSRRSSRGS